MGAYISTITLLVGSIAVGVLASMAANYSRKMSWTSAQNMGIGTAVAAALFALAAIIILIVEKQKSSAGLGITSMISFIFLIVCIVAGCAMSTIAVFAVKKQDKSRSEGMFAGTAALMFFAFIASIVMFFLI